MNERDTEMENWIVAGLRANDDEAPIVAVARHIWENHEAQLRSSEHLFFTWQYQMRWAAQRLEDAGKIKRFREGRFGRWRLVPAR